MAYDGNGAYALPAPQYPAVAGNTIYAEDFNTLVADIATALSNVLVRDGQAAMTGDLDMGAKQIKNIAKIAAVVAGLVVSGTVTFQGAVSMLDNLNVAKGLTVTQAAALNGGGTTVTKAAGTNTTDIATCAFVLQTAMNAALPLQTGNAGKALYTDGTNAGWQAVPAPTIGYSARTANAQLGVADAQKLIDITYGTFTQTFAACATLGAGWWCYLRNSGSQLTNVPIAGDFSADVGWTKGTGWTISGGVANSAAATGYLTANPAPLVNGRNYRLTFTISRTSGDLKVYMGAAVSLGPGDFSWTGTYSIEFTASGSALFFASGTNAFTGTLDNVILEEIVSAEITLDPNGAETIDGLTSYVMYPGETRLIICDGVSLRSTVVQAFIKTYSTSGTFVMPPGYLGATADVIGGGGGGGGGSSSGYGGGGGGGGGRGITAVPGIPAGTQVTVTVGAGGAGGTSGGGAGGGGGVSSFGSYASAQGGVITGAAPSAGSGGASGPVQRALSGLVATGYVGAGSPSNNNGSPAEWGGASGGSGSNTGAPGYAGAGSLSGGASGGGGGGSGASAAGGQGGAAGTTTTGTGGPGANTWPMQGAPGKYGTGASAGSGGGGGMTNGATSAGSNGGAGGFPGGGGGGGGGYTGAGGVGGAGRVVVSGF